MYSTKPSRASLPGRHAPAMFHPCVPAVLSASMTHLYAFDEGTANDSIGGANGLLENGATVQNGQLYFNSSVNNGQNNPATGQYVLMPYNVVHTSNFTIEAWATTRVASSWQRILDLGNSYGDAGYGFQMLTPYGYAGEGLFSQISLYDSGGSGDTNYVTTNVVA